MVRLLRQKSESPREFIFLSMSDRDVSGRNLRSNTRTFRSVSVALGEKGVTLWNWNTRLPSALRGIAS